MTDHPRVNRIAFRLSVHPELIEEYRAQHVAVWPEMREALKRCGWHRYSLFLDDDGTLFGYFETLGTLDDAVTAMQAEPVNERWQALMAPYFVAGGDTRADQQMRQLSEVFHLP
jgi:L-rhamnose mutarotase